MATSLGERPTHRNTPPDLDHTIARQLNELIDEAGILTKIGAEATTRLAL